MQSDIKTLFDRISAAKHCVALTGAGVSTLSGIRDFRGKNGLYNDMDAEKMFDIDYFEQDPSFYYKTAGAFIYNADERPASIVHTTLGDMEKRGLVKAVITQNIDMLHQKGGSRRVIEVHGSPDPHYCLSCGGVRMSFAEAAAIVKKGEMPRCPNCGRALKPAITFFGERLPANALREAEAEASSADLMLVLGTSLTVYPAAGIPESALRHGGKLVIVNEGATPLDSRADMRFESLESVFKGLKELLG
ncbi:MAG: NAD-dependent deacetylase [Spirochaetaceae bacterium]|nr:NAD-dependent deacetylase [Spirochaetaceae bacterium]